MVGRLIFLYGPPGAGKSVVGKQLAKTLNFAFTDLDESIVTITGKSIPEIFKNSGEEGFRKLESEALAQISKNGSGVVSLGGGTLLSRTNLNIVKKSGQIFRLEADHEILSTRLTDDKNLRPLLSDQSGEKLLALLKDRQEHYASFPNPIETSNLTIEEVVGHIQVLIGHFIVSGMGTDYPVIIQHGNLTRLGTLLQDQKLHGPIAVISDNNVGDLYGELALQSLRKVGYSAELIVMPAGEEQKKADSLTKLWDRFLELNLERRSTIIALGGGVIGDLSGFAAATYLRGIPWVVVPTTLLAMVDSSLGGKTGIDLPAGKNLAGAFHAPSIVVTDPQLLKSLPEKEMKNGIAEVVKYGVISDPDLFEICSQDWDKIKQDLTNIIRQAAAVKINTIQIDPHEKGIRAALNFGHTIGHAVESLSNFSISHGEAISIGMVVETRLAEEIGIAKPNLADKVQDVLENLGLPVKIPASISTKAIIDTIQYDKKRAKGKVLFSLAKNIGEIQTGVAIQDLESLLEKG